MQAVFSDTMTPAGTMTSRRHRWCSCLPLLLGYNCLGELFTWQLFYSMAYPLPLPQHPFHQFTGRGLDRLIHFPSSTSISICAALPTDRSKSDRCEGRLQFIWIWTSSSFETSNKNLMPLVLQTLANTRVLYQKCSLYKPASFWTQLQRTY